MNHHFDALGLQEGASQEEIEGAYKRLSKELDPANNNNQEFFKEEYKKLQQAYKALSASSILATQKGAKQIVKKPNSSTKNKNDSVKPIEDKLNTPKKKNVRRDILLLFIAIGVSVLLLQNFGFFDYIKKEYQRKNMTVLQRRAQDIKELTKEEQLDLMWDFGASEEEFEEYKERRIFWIMGSYQEAYKILALQEGATQEEIQEAYDRLRKELNPANQEAYDRLSKDNQQLFLRQYQRLSKAYSFLKHLVKPLRVEPLWEATN
jgi:curved DNA-binding protein CbpA